MEKSFEILGVAEGQKTVFATYIMKGEANYWWEAKRNLEGRGVVAWERFSELFLEKYFPRFMETQMELKFLELKQGNMTVAEYEAKFTELSRFVPEYVNTEAKRARRFQLGLKQWIQNRVAVLELTDYATLVQKASIIEAGSEQLQNEKEGKKRKFDNRKGNSTGGSFPNRFKRGAISQPSGNFGTKRAESWSVGQGGRPHGSAYSTPSRPPLPNCNNCGNKHPGACNRQEVRCFKCGLSGHYASACQGSSVKTQGGITCFECGKPGHRSRNACLLGQLRQELVELLLTSPLLLGLLT